jgi:ABC-2 type transport system permease protein
VRRGAESRKDGNPRMSGAHSIPHSGASGASGAQNAPRSAASRVRGGVRLFAHYVRFNLSAGMEYRVSFITQVVGMFLNNSAFIVFWVVLYSNLQEVNGYGFSDVMFLWALTSLGFGLADVFLGNAPQLSRTITSGELDVYLLQPKPPLINFLLSRMHVSGWGDIIYGIVLYVLTQAFSPAHIALFALFSILMALILVGLRVFYHCFTFFLGNAEEFAFMASEMALSFSLYPGSIFKGPVRFLLHSLIPAALIAYIPSSLVRSFDPVLFLVLILADAGVLIAAWGAFRLGLRRYESGNRMGTRL